MKIVRGVLHCDEWFLNEYGEMPSIPALLAFQKRVVSNKSKYKQPERIEQKDLYVDVNK